MNLLGYGLAFTVGIVLLPVSLPIMVGLMVRDSRKERKERKAMHLSQTPQPAVFGAPTMMSQHLTYTQHLSHRPQGYMYHSCMRPDFPAARLIY